jgi:hypothetical protein
MSALRDLFGALAFTLMGCAIFILILFIWSLF